MTIKKGYLETLFLVLKGTEGRLNLAESRTRDVFVKPLTETLMTFEADRKVIYEKFCKKNDAGEPDITESNYSFAPDVIGEVTKELTTLLEEEVEIPVVQPSALLAVMERSSYNPKIGEAAVIDELMAQLDPSVPSPYIENEPKTAD